MSSELRAALIRWAAAQRVLRTLHEQQEQQDVWHVAGGGGGGAAASVTEEDRIVDALRSASVERHASASAQVADRSILCTEAWNHVLDVVTRELNEAATVVQHV